MEPSLIEQEDLLLLLRGNSPPNECRTAQTRKKAKGRQQLRRGGRGRCQSQEGSRRWKGKNATLCGKKKGHLTTGEHQSPMKRRKSPKTGGSADTVEIANKKRLPATKKFWRCTTAAEKEGRGGGWKNYSTRRSAMAPARQAGPPRKVLGDEGETRGERPR